MLIDSHCHIPEDKATLENQLINAKENGVSHVVGIGTQLGENERVLRASKEFENVFGAIAIYPNSELEKDISTLLTELEKQLTKSPKSKIVAIGECGIDITDWKKQRSIENQIELFELQIKLAIKNKLPVIVHNRNGDDQVLELLNKYKGHVQGVIHCFTGDWEFAQKILALGFYISFSGHITHKSKEYLCETVLNVLMDKFLVETDSPYILPKGVNRKPNEPKNVKIVAQKIADIKGINLREVISASRANTAQLFGLNL